MLCLFICVLVGWLVDLARKYFHLEILHYDETGRMVEKPEYQEKSHIQIGVIQSYLLIYTYQQQLRLWGLRWDSTRETIDWCRGRL